MFQTKLKLAAVLLFAVGVLSAGAVWLMHPAAASAPTEEAEAATAADDQPPEVYALLRLEREELRLRGGAQPEPSGEDFALMRRTQAAILKSRAILGAALRQPAVAQLPLVRQQRDPVGWLEKALRVDSPNDAELLRVGMNGYKPEEMAAVVNAVVGVYMEDFIEREKERRLPRLKMLEDVYSQYQERMKVKRADLVSLARARGNPDDHDSTAAIRQQVMVQDILNCKRELRRVRLEEATLRIQMERKLGDQRSLEHKLAIQIEQKRLLREEEAKLWDRVRELASQGLNRDDLQHVQREIDEVGQSLKRINTESEQLRIELATSRSRIILLQEAEAPKVR